jgi:hypothetical protein
MAISLDSKLLKEAILKKPRYKLSDAKPMLSIYPTDIIGF